MSDDEQYIPGSAHKRAASSNKLGNELADLVLNCTNKEQAVEAFDKACQEASPDSVISGMYSQSSFHHVYDVLDVMERARIFQRGPEQIKTVAFYYFSLGTGGANAVNLELAALFLELGYSVVLLCDSKAEEGTVPEETSFVQLPAFWNCDSDQYHIRARAIRNAIEKYSIDAIVYSQWLCTTLPWDVSVAKAYGARVIIHTHGSFAMITRYAFRDFLLLPKAYKQADAIVCLSESNRRFWQQTGVPTYTTINPARYRVADTPASSLLGDSILWIGRLDPNEKHPEEALCIFAELTALNSKAELTLVGGGEEQYTMQLKSLASELGIAHRVHFEGEQNDPRPYYKNASVLLTTSPFEGYPLVLAESKVYGIPCVMYEIPTLYFAENPHGLVSVPQKDRKAAARELSRFLSDRTYLKQMGADAREQARQLEGYDRERFWIEVISSIESGKRNDAVDSADTIMWEETMRACYDNACEREERLASALARIEELESSTSMKIGRALTRIPGKLKHAFTRDSSK